MATRQKSMTDCREHTAALGRVAASNECRRTIGPVTMEVVDLKGAKALVLAALRSHATEVFAFCNMHTWNLARTSPRLAAALSSATVFNDGVGIDVASRILFGQPFPANLNGTDLMPAVLAAIEEPTNVFIVGSPCGVAEEAAKRVEQLNANVRVVGTHHGFFLLDETDVLLQRIRDAQTRLLIVGMGNPRQELWAVDVAVRSGAVVMCVGAFLDFISGRITRAPKFIRVIRAEWLYRFALEPSRMWRRYLGGAIPFLWAVMHEKLKPPR